MTINQAVKKFWPQLEIVFKYLKVPAEIQHDVKICPEDYCHKKGKIISAFTQGWGKPPIKLHLTHKNGELRINYKDKTKAAQNLHLSFQCLNNINYVQLYFFWRDGDVIVRCNLPHTEEIAYIKRAPATQDEHLLSAIAAPEISPQARSIFYCMLDDSLFSALKRLNTKPIENAA